MVRIGAITGIVIKLGLYQLCFLAMISLVGLPTFSKSPPIGGETCVQIHFWIWTRLIKDLLMGPVYPNCIGKPINSMYLYRCTKYAFESKGCYRSSDAWGLTWLTPDVMPNRYWRPFPGGSFLSIHFEGSYWMRVTGAIPGLPNPASHWDYSDLAGVELVMSKTDCGDCPPRGSRRTVGRVRRVWDGARCPTVVMLPSDQIEEGCGSPKRGVTLKPFVPAYNTQPSLAVMWVARSRWQAGGIVRNVLCGWTLWSHQSRCPQRNYLEVGDTKFLLHTSRVEGILYPTPALQGSGVTKQFVKG